MAQQEISQVGEVVAVLRVQGTGGRFSSHPGRGESWRNWDEGARYIRHAFVQRASQLDTYYPAKLGHTVGMGGENVSKSRE